MIGRIRTLVWEKGYGFVRAEGGTDYFFHRTDVLGEGIDAMREGDSVEFEATDTPKGPRAEQVRRL
jgi:cold shock protein